MTKEEFLSMLSSELEKLEQEYEIVRQKVEYLRAVNGNDEEFQKAERQQKNIREKCDILSKLVTLPAYARIQAMSDIEIEEYKKEKIEELELKVKEIEIKEEQAKEKLSQLKAEQEQLIAQFGNVSGSERDKIIYRGKQLSTEISKYDVNSQSGVFADFKREIEQIRKQQEQIKTMTSQEIKQQLSSEIKFSNIFARTIEFTPKYIDASTELAASVAGDEEKSKKMASLLKYYRDLSDLQSQVKCMMHLSYGIPKTLESIIEHSKSYYNSTTGEVYDPDKMMRLLQDFKMTFEEEKAKFYEKFTEEKMINLCYSKNIEHGKTIDMEFLQRHIDILGKLRLENLQNLVEQRNKLEKKIFKTSSIKSQIEDLNNRIIQDQSKAYREIIGWYRIQNGLVLGIENVYPLIFDSEYSIKRYLEECRKTIDSSEYCLKRQIEYLQKAIAKMEQERQMYETKKNEVAQQIRTLGGEKYKETDIPYASESVGENLDRIRNAQNLIYQRDVVNSVQQEAQNQADVRESELRGITIEELQELKKQVQAMVDETKVETAEEEVSHGIKR